MGTHSRITLIANGRKVHWFHHHDGYPSGVGKDMADDVKKLLEVHSVEEIKEMIGKVKIIHSDDEPELADEEVVHIEAWTGYSFTHAQGFGKDWYRILHQDTLTGLLKIGYIYDETERQRWNYKLDFDADVFSINHRCRWTQRFPLTAIPANWLETVETTETVFKNLSVDDQDGDDRKRSLVFHSHCCHDRMFINVDYRTMRGQVVRTPIHESDSE